MDKNNDDYEKVSNTISQDEQVESDLKAAQHGIKLQKKVGIYALDHPLHKEAHFMLCEDDEKCLHHGP